MFDHLRQYTSLKNPNGDEQDCYGQTEDSADGKHELLEFRFMKTKSLPKRCANVRYMDLNCIQYKSSHLIMGRSLELITLEFTGGRTWQIQGENLNYLYNLLVQKQVGWIREVGDEKAMINLHVFSILDDELIKQQKEYEAAYTGKAR